MKQILFGCGIQSDTKQKRDKALPLGESMTPETQPLWVGSSPILYKMQQLMNWDLVKTKFLILKMINYGLLINFDMFVKNVIKDCNLCSYFYV